MILSTLNNKTVQEISPIPFLTKNLIYIGDKIMADLKRTKEKKICQVDGCGKILYSKGLCSRHYHQVLRTGSILETYRDRPSTTCAISGCRGKLHIDGLCNKHYEQMYFDGKINQEPDSICNVPSCIEPMRRNGYCERHSAQVKRTGKIIETYMDKPPRVCDVDGCEKLHHSNGYCLNHSRQFNRYGYIKARTRLDPNEIRFNGDDCYISLYDTFGEFITETVIDKDRYLDVSSYKWRMSAQGYAVCNIASSKKQLFLHHIILGKPPEGYETDHKDQNKLNNRYFNLRFATHPQNMWNTSVQSNNTSGFKGVYLNPITSRWRAAIRADGSPHYLGSFVKKEDAIIAYDTACKELHGEFACTNDRILANAS